MFSPPDIVFHNLLREEPFLLVQKSSKHVMKGKDIPFFF